MPRSGYILFCLRHYLYNGKHIEPRDVIVYITDTWYKFSVIIRGQKVPHSMALDSLREVCPALPHYSMQDKEYNGSFILKGSSGESHA